jgi:hypothetical protein
VVKLPLTINAISVAATEDFHLIVKLEDGRSFNFNMSYILKETGPIVQPLKNIEEFQKVFIQHGIVTWPSGFDIDPYFLIANGILIDKSA